MKATKLYFGLTLIFFLFLSIITGCEKDSDDLIEITQESPAVQPTPNDVIKLEISKTYKNNNPTKDPLPPEFTFQTLSKAASGNLSVQKVAITLDGDYIWEPGEELIMAILVWNDGPVQTDVSVVEANYIQDSNDIESKSRIQLEVLSAMTGFDNPFWDIPIIPKDAFTVRTVSYVAPDVEGVTASLFSTATFLFSFDGDTECTDDQGMNSIAIIP